MNAGRIDFSDARYGAAPIRRALDEARITQVLSSHDAMLKRMAAFNLFKRHWKPKGTGPGAHGHTAKNSCAECKALNEHFPDFEAAVSKAGGIDRVSTERAAAQLVAPPLPPPPGGPAPVALGAMVPPVAPPPAGGHRVVMHPRRVR